MTIIEILSEEEYEYVTHEGSDAGHEYYEGLTSSGIVYEFKVKQADNGETEVHGRPAMSEDWNFMFNVDEEGAYL